MRSLAALALAGVLAAPGSAPSDAPGERPSGADRWRWNARERTASGRAALADGDATAAVEAFDAALRLRPTDPRTSYNSGTARIDVDPKAAAPLLDDAARQAGPRLAPSAWYNLGTARLASGDPKGAADAFVESLRRDPANADAKQNLELALAALAEQQKQQSGGQQRSPAKPNSDGESSSSAGGDQEESPSKSAADQQDGPERQSESPSERDRDAQESAPSTGAGAPTGSEEGNRPLPQFHDLPDMTAEQAAAILRSVEDLERQQRRDKALRDAAQRAKVEKDW